MDTIGELAAVWGLADVAFVGGSLDGKRGGQNMIEPAAYGAAVVFGPHVWNFRDAAARLVEMAGAVQVKSFTEMEAAVGRLLGSPAQRRAWRSGPSLRRLAARREPSAPCRRWSFSSNRVCSRRAKSLSPP